MQDWLDDKLDDGDITRERLTRIVAASSSAPLEHPGHHLHQQGRGGAKASGWRRCWGSRQLDIQASTFHSRLRAHPAAGRSTALGYRAQLHHLRHRRLACASSRRRSRSWTIDEKRVRAQGHPLGRSAAAKDQLLAPEDVLRGGRGATTALGGCRPRSTSYYQKRLQAANAVDFDDIILLDRPAVPAVPRCAGILPQPVPLHHGGRVPGHQPRPVSSWCSLLAQGGIRTSAWWATTTRASISSGAPPSRTSSSFENQFPGRQGHPAGAELPLHPDHPGRGQRGHRQQHRSARARPSGPKTATGDKVTGLPRARRAGGGRALSPTPSWRTWQRGTKFADHAILYRMNAQSNMHRARRWSAAGIPYRIIGGPALL